ncbi:hypothetical protein AYO42_05990 [Rhizomicrobium sp. SCGC AG-212-E05]|nr:hypothetical protein AYO42_05990 [Rhizomicrobium sp. SCGC AG-212-E05]
MLIKATVHVRKWWPAPPLFGLLALFIYTGWVGLDFGRHWDEFIHYNHVVNTLRSGIILPFKCSYNFCYIYPSITYFLSFITTTLSLLMDGGVSHVREAAAGGLSLHDFGLITRPAFLFICALSGLWVYVALSKTDRIAATIAAAIPLLSWEYAYHARWIAPDAVMAQFCALWVLAIFRAEGAANARQWLIFATIAAALATGTKYTAGALFFATIFFAWLIECGAVRQLKLGKFPLKFSSLLLAIFIATFIVTTPGAILQPVDFIRDVRAGSSHYAAGHFPTYGVSSYDIRGAFDYAARLWEYIGLALLSPIPALSLMLLVTAPLGYLSLRKNGKCSSAVTLVTVLLFYTLFFSSRTSVFIVRNFLFFLPIIAVLIGAGISSMIRGARVTQILAMALLFVAGVTNAYSLVTAARTISPNSDSMLVGQLSEYIERHPSEKFALSRSLSRDMRGRRAVNQATVAQADIFVYRDSDLRSTPSITLKDYPGTRHNTFVWIGPHEVNYNYYPTWEGRDRILLLPLKDAVRMGLPAVIPQP